MSLVVRCRAAFLRLLARSVDLKLRDFGFEFDLLRFKLFIGPAVHRLDRHEAATISFQAKDIGDLIKRLIGCRTGP